MKKAGGTTRGVFAVDKAGKVLLAEPGGPASTVEAVKRIVGGGEGVEAKEAAQAEEAANGQPPKTEQAATAAEVADTAAKVDAPAAAT